MTLSVDLAIIGSGFGGSLLAMIARRLGLTVALIERTRHPRFAIGESSTPLANLLLEEIARRYELPALLPFTKWGPWQRAHPAVGCGLKRGFSFYHHQPGQAWTTRDDRANELLVAASPRDEIADTHWYRSDFDHALARMATQLGAELLEDTLLCDLSIDGTGARLVGRGPAGALTVRARFVIDASGPRGFVSRRLALPESAFAGLPATQALFSHFQGVHRWDHLHPAQDTPPFPVDDAALHHVFPGGWIWVLRFSNGITSAGVAAESGVANALSFQDGPAAWDRLLARLPSVRDQFAEAQPCLPFHYSPTLSCRTSKAAGPGWALLPSAAGFVDPLLSTGFPLTLLGLQRLARLLEEDWESPRWPAALGTYEGMTLAELDRSAGLIAALYRHLADFPSFVNLTLLYFAAASFSESARRLGQATPAAEFLLGDHPTFGPALQECLAGALASPQPHADLLAERVRRAIDPVNIAGLANPARRNWYPALAEDLLASAGKLGVDRPSIEAMLNRVGFQTAKAD